MFTKHFLVTYSWDGEKWEPIVIHSFNKYLTLSTRYWDKVKYKMGKGGDSK